MFPLRYLKGVRGEVVNIWAVHLLAFLSSSEKATSTGLRNVCDYTWCTQVYIPYAQLSLGRKSPTNTHLVNLVRRQATIIPECHGL